MWGRPQQKCACFCWAFAHAYACTCLTCACAHMQTCSCTSHAGMLAHTWSAYTHGVRTQKYTHTQTHTHIHTHTHTHIDLHMFSDLISVDTLFREAGISPNGQVKISEFVQTIMTPSPDYWAASATHLSVYIPDTYQLLFYSFIIHHHVSMHHSVLHSYTLNIVPGSDCWLWSPFWPRGLREHSVIAVSFICATWKLEFPICRTHSAVFIHECCCKDKTDETPER